MIKKKKITSLLLLLVFLLQLVPAGIRLSPNKVVYADTVSPVAAPINILGNVGDCETTTGWTATNGIIALNQNQKVFGSNSLNFTTTAVNGVVSKDISSVLKKEDKYYLVSVYFKNSAVDFSLSVMDLVGSTYTSLCETTKQLAGTFKRVGVKLNADSISSSSMKRELRVNVAQTGLNGSFDGIMINEISEEEYLSDSVDTLLGKYPYSGGTKQPTYPVKVGNNSAFVIGEDGTVKTWGVNTGGQLGIGNTANQPNPVTISGLTDVRNISVGENHGMAVLNDGTVKAWGKNTYGQLGINSVEDKLTPVDVLGLYGVKQVSIGQNHSLALMEDGTVKAWGLNSFGQLGFGDNVERHTPETIPGLAGVKQIVAGYNSSYAVMKDGTVKSWGLNMYGRLGLGDFENRNMPTTIPDLINVSYLAAGTYSVFVHTQDEKIMAWGSNSYGQLGLGDKKDRTKPEILDISGVKRIVGGYDFAAACMNDGTVMTWGRNDCGQLGIGNTTDQVYPQTIPELEGVKILEVGGSYALAVLNDGTMKYWGRKIGDVTITSVPTDISLSSIRKNSSPVFGINYPSSYTEDGVKASEIGTDGNCESTTGWTVSNSTVAVDTSGKLYGSNAIKGTLSGTSAGYVYRNVKTVLNSSKYYFITAYVKSGAANTINLFCNFGSEKNATAYGSTSYVRQGIKIQPSDMTTATEYKVGLKLNAGTAGQYGLMDNLMIIEITADEYAKLTEGQLMEKYSYKNLLESDGDCEEIGAWNANTGIATLDATNKIVGNNGIKLVGNSGVASGLGKNLVPLNTSKCYFFSGYGKSASGGNLVMSIGDTYGTSTTGGTTGNFTSSTLTRKGFKFKPTSSMGVLSVVANAITGQQHTAYFDGMMLREITQNEYNTLNADQLMERYPYEGSKTEFAVNTVSPATLKLKSSDNNVVISVSDIDNDVLTCKLYVDDEVDARDTKVVSNSCQEQDISLALGSIAEGNHLIKVEVWDGTEVVQYSVNVNATQRIKHIENQGLYTSYAIMEDGTVKAWGGNSYGQLGSGDNESRSYPNIIPELLNVNKIVSSGTEVYAIMNDGTVKAWGYNENGQLGLGYKGDYVFSPTQINGLSNIADIVTTGLRSYAISNDGYLFYWEGSTSIYVSIKNPTKVSSISGVKEVQTNGSTTLIKCNDNKLYLWGDSGNGTQYNNIISIGSDIKDFLINGSCMYRILSDGTVYAWGNNSNYYLGIGSNSGSFNYANGFTLSGISGAKKIFGKNGSTFVLCENGEVWAWGDNYYGQLGLGDKNLRMSPVKIDAFNGAKAILSTKADCNTIAIFNDFIKVAGFNSGGELGVGHKNEVLQPQVVSFNKVIQEITCGYHNSYVRFNDGSVKCFGSYGLGLEDSEKLVPYDFNQGTSMPKIINCSLKNNQIINVNGDKYCPTITIYDNDNDILDLKCYLDNSEVPFFSQIVGQNTVKTQQVIIDSLNLSNLAEGFHSIKIKVSDCIGTTPFLINFTYDRSPTNSLINITSTTNTIISNAYGTDLNGMDSLPYRFSISSSNSGWIEASETTRITQIASGESVGGIVKTDSGYITGVINGSKIYMYRSIDNGLSWINIGFINNVTSNDYSIYAKGNMVYCLFRSDINPNYNVKFIKFDSAAISGGSEILGASNVYNDTYATGGGGLTVAIDGTNRIHIAFRTERGGLIYKNSADGTTWSSDMTIVSPSYIYKSGEPRIVFDNQGLPNIIYKYYNDVNILKSIIIDNTKKISSNIYIGKEFSNSSPSVFIDKSGKRHVVWLAYDKTDNTKYNVFYSSSIDGRTWTQAVKLTKGNTYDCSYPTIFVDTNYRVHIAWCRNNQIEQITFYKTWSEIEKFNKGVNAYFTSFCSNTKELSQPVMVYRDNSSNMKFVEFRSGGTSYTFSSLLPGTKYTVQFETKDVSGNIAVSTKDIYTKAAVPSATIGTKTATTANVTITDTNGTDTKYKMKVGDKYLLSDGTLSTKADLLTSKSIKIKGLKANTTYQVYVKAINGENIETKYSTAVALTTVNSVPGVPVNIKTASYGTSVKASWDELDGAQSYDVEIDSVVYSNVTATSFVKTGLTAGVSHNVRVRGVNAVGAGTWSSIYTTTIAASKSTQIPVNYSVGKIFNIVLSAGSLKDADICTFKLTYDPTKLEVLDLCADTIEKELITGDIADTGIKVIEFNSATGVIRYSVIKAANDGAAWTGALNSVKFRSKSTTPSTITYILE